MMNEVKKENVLYMRKYSEMDVILLSCLTALLKHTLVVSFFFIIKVDLKCVEFLEL